MSKELTSEQEKTIAKTLKRIRAGLARFQKEMFLEPAHYFFPEAFYDVSK